MTTTSYQRGGVARSGGGCQGDRSRADAARTMVSQFSQAKLPERTSHSWVTIIRQAAPVATGCGCEQQEGHGELGDVVGRHLHPVRGPRQMVEEPAQRARHRLCLVVEVQAGELAPARVAAHLDQPGAELHAEEHPPQQEQDQDGRCDLRRCRGRRRGSRPPGAATPSRSRTRSARRSRWRGTAPTGRATAPSRPTAAGARRARRAAPPPPRSPARRTTRRTGPNSAAGTGSAPAGTAPAPHSAAPAASPAPR